MAYYKIDFNDAGGHAARCGVGYPPDLEVIQEPPGVAYDGCLRSTRVDGTEVVRWYRTTAKAFEAQQRLRPKGCPAVAGWPAREISEGEYRAILAQKAGRADNVVNRRTLRCIVLDSERLRPPLIEHA